VTSEFLWAGRAKPTRGPKPALTLDQIADAAIAIADAEGLAAVSMQRVAADLGYTKMSLYRYLPGKTELVAAMIERGIGEAPDLSGQTWRECLTCWCEALLARVKTHAWTSEATVGARPIGPNEIAWMEVALRELPAGLTGAERLDTVATLAAHVRTLAVQSVQAEREMINTMGIVLRDHAARFPAVVAAITEVSQHGGDEQAFQFGLARILDGIDAYIKKV
jgi:AcrR family transcriptional regulator